MSGAPCSRSASSCSAPRRTSRHRRQLSRPATSQGCRSVRLIHLSQATRASGRTWNLNRLDGDRSSSSRSLTFLHPMQMSRTSPRRATSSRPRATSSPCTTTAASTRARSSIRPASADSRSSSRVRLPGRPRCAQVCSCCAERHVDRYGRRTVGAGQVIKGWDQGLLDMVRRRLNFDSL